MGGRSVEVPASVCPRGFLAQLCVLWLRGPTPEFGGALAAAEAGHSYRDLWLCRSCEDSEVGRGGWPVRVKR